MTPLERFNKKYIPVTESGCWLWIAGLFDTGYGQFSVNGKPTLAHRFAYIAYIGNIPDGLEIDHLCRVRCCVNPDHMEPVSTKTNVLRGAGVTAINAKKTHCKRGHLFTDENTIKVKSPPGRGCRACAALYRIDNIEKYRQYYREYHLTNKEKLHGPGL